MAQPNSADLRDFFFDVVSSCPGVFSHIPLHTLQAMLGDDGWMPRALLPGRDRAGRERLRFGEEALD